MSSASRGLTSTFQRRALWTAYYKRTHGAYRAARATCAGTGGFAAVVAAKPPCTVTGHRDVGPRSAAARGTKA
eukprot:3174170-Prymnesium_polylepis.1